jgi:2'-5' RNA ligase
MSDTIRTFIAFQLPENIVSSVRKIQEGLKSCGFKVRWVPPQNIHLTLKFLGDVDTAAIGKIGDAIINTAKGQAPLSLAAKGVGVFPRIKRPRVLWIGIVGQINPLTNLQKFLDAELEKVGFPRESRPFKGHLTLGRVKGKIDSGRLVEAMRAYQGFESEAFVADKIFLFKSELKPAGAVYTKLMRVPL